VANCLRYTEYVYMLNPDPNEGLGLPGFSYTPDWSKQSDLPELYNLDSDPMETTNLAQKNWTEGIREELSRRLRQGWRGELKRSFSFI